MVGASLRNGVTRFGSCGAFLRPRSERRLLPFIYPSLLRDGVSLRVVCVFFTLDRNEVYFGLLFGIPSGWGHPIGSGSDDLTSNEGITAVGLLGAVFPASPRGVFVSPFGLAVCSVAEWVPHSSVFASGVDSVCVPLAIEGVGLGPSSSGPVTSCPPLGIGLLRWPRGVSFHLGVFMRWSSTHGRLASGFWFLA